MTLCSINNWIQKAFFGPALQRSNITSNTLIGVTVVALTSLHCYATAINEQKPQNSLKWTVVIIAIAPFSPIISATAAVCLLASYLLAPPKELTPASQQTTFASSLEGIKTAITDLKASLKWEGQSLVNLSISYMPEDVENCLNLSELYPLLQGLETLHLYAPKSRIIDFDGTSAPKSLTSLVINCADGQSSATTQIVNLRCLENLQNFEIDGAPNLVEGLDFTGLNGLTSILLKDLTHFNSSLDFSNLSNLETLRLQHLKATEHPIRFPTSLKHLDLSDMPRWNNPIPLDVMPNLSHLRIYGLEQFQKKLALQNSIEVFELYSCKFFASEITFSSNMQLHTFKMKYCPSFDSELCFNQLPELINLEYMYNGSKEITLKLTQNTKLVHARIEAPGLLSIGGGAVQQEVVYTLKFGTGNFKAIIRSCDGGLIVGPAAEQVLTLTQLAAIAARQAGLEEQNPYPGTAIERHLNQIKFCYNHEGDEDKQPIEAGSYKVTQEGDTQIVRPSCKGCATHHTTAASEGAP